MLDGRQVTLAIRLLDEVGALPYLLPDLEALKGVTQSAPHISNVWDHTLNTVQALEQLLQPLLGAYQEESAEDLTLGTAVLWLGRFREKLDAHFNRRLVPDRSLRALLFLAALYHDIAKPQTRSVTTEGRVRFLDHTTQGVYQVAHRARELALSAAEVSRLETLVGQHMRVHFLLDSSKHEARPRGEEYVSRRSIYRFFKDTGEAGVDICLLTLADTWATYGVTLPPELWQGELQICRSLLEAYWEKSEEVVSPTRFLSGDDLMVLFGIKPGRKVGRLLSAIREAQAAGEVHDRAEAEAFAHHWLDRYSDSEEISREQGEG
jgi:putative nucleotidyltransferase with HDIG domain